MCLPTEGVSAWGCLPAGCLPGEGGVWLSACWDMSAGGVYPSACWDAHPPVNRMTDRQV